MRRVWPFKPLTPVIESLEWATDVFRAKASEQRIALRVQPRRFFSFAHFLRDKDANYTRALVRASMADGGFYVPDWPQAVSVGDVSSGAAVVIPAGLESYYYGEMALLWQSPSKYEILDITWDSNGLTADVVGNYTDAMIMPVWEGNCPEGVSITRDAANQNVAQIAFVLTESADLSGSDYPLYRGHDVVTDCPVIASSSIEESTSFELSTFDSVAGIPEYLRARDLPEFTGQMNWLVTSKDDTFALRRFLHSRKGRQKAFWLSSHGSDLEFSSVSGTTLTVFNDILARPAPFDIEVTTTTKERRRVTVVSLGTPVAGRATVDLTIDSALSSTDVKKVSILTCFRFDSDRAEIEHNAKPYARLSMPLREVPVP